MSDVRKNNWFLPFSLLKHWFQTFSALILPNDTYNSLMSIFSFQFVAFQVFTKRISSAKRRKVFKYKQSNTQHYPHLHTLSQRIRSSCISSFTQPFAHSNLFYLLPPTSTHSEWRWTMCLKILKMKWQFNDFWLQNGSNERRENKIYELANIYQILFAKD